MGSIPAEPSSWPPPPRLTHSPGSAQKSVSFVSGTVRARQLECGVFNKSFPRACLRLGAVGCEYVVYKPGGL
jgi:hypothetical protein